MRTAILSDLHLGSSGGADLLRRPDLRRVLWSALAGADRVVLLGDAIELRDRPLSAALAASRPFFAELAEAIGDASLLLVPVNHDHHLLEGWLEHRRIEQAPPLGLEERIVASTGPAAELAREAGLEGVELAYPGVWLRSGVYATHGHFLDRHLTVPTFERLAVAAVERVLGTGREPDRVEASPERGSATPEDYERAQAPVYAFLFALAQAGGTDERFGGSNPSARVWQAVGGGYSRAAKLRGWLLGTVAVPGAVGVANRLGLGPVRSDLSPGGITRAGLAAIAEVERALDIGADHLIFGHTHRRGPIRGETGWRLDTGTRLWNTGSWVFSPGLLGESAAESPYWPGTVVWLEDELGPRPEHLLDALSKDELAE